MTHKANKKISQVCADENDGVDDDYSEMVYQIFLTELDGSHWLQHDEAGRHHIDYR